MENNNQENINRPKVGVAVSGGFIRATAAIGVIEVLLEYGIPIDSISGCSAGAGIAASYAAGNMPEIKHQLVRGSGRTWFNHLFDLTVPTQGLLKREKTRIFIDRHFGDKHFHDLDIPTYIVATDLNSLSPVVLNEGLVRDAMQSAFGVPGFFVPVRHGNRLLTDGANFNLIPSRPLYDNGADYVIAIDASRPPNVLTQTLSKFNKGKKVDTSKVTLHQNPGIFRLVARAVRLSSSNIDNFDHTNYKYDALIKPQLKEFKRLDVHRVEELIERGRQAAEKMIPQIKKDLNL